MMSRSGIDTLEDPFRLYRYRRAAADLLRQPRIECDKPAAPIRPLTVWDVYLARHTPAKWIGTAEAVDADAAIAEAAFCIHGEFRRITGRGVDTTEAARNGLQSIFCVSTEVFNRTLSACPPPSVRR
jgi:hypothetical protein